MSRYPQHPSRPHAPAAPAPRPAIPRLMRLALFLSVAFCVLPGATATAQAQSVETRRSYDIAGGPLSQVLNAYASAAGVELSMDATLLQGKHSNGLSGSAFTA